MLLNSVSFYNFRNNDTATLPFSEGVNVICGKNAAGKTNILEAVFFFAAGKSFRSCKERDMIRFGEQDAKIEIDFSGSEGTHTLAASLSRRRKKEMFRDGIKICRLSEYLGKFRAVVFTPDHLSLVKGSPERRRRFLDIAICQNAPKYVALLNEYNRVLLQKNALLRSFEASPQLLEVYNERLAYLGAQISVRRYRYLSRLGKAAEEIHSEMSSGTEQLTLRYISPISSTITSEEESEKAYLALYKAKTAAELKCGVSLVGSHKDDFETQINARDARLFCSQGQQRSAVLSLKLAEGELSKFYTGEYPVFLLDDILSELDVGRRSFILGNLVGKQVIITACEDIPTPVDNRIFVENGKYTVQ